MSTEIDNKIVRMQFDNAQFEAGVMQSMKTLDELNGKLQFKEVSKGISALQVCLNGVDFTSLINGVNHIESYFTSMTGMVKKAIKEDIVDSVLQAAQKLESATLGQIKSGGWNRAMNMANAQFTIEGLKYSWEEVKKAADYAVTDTAYGLDVAAKAASQLAASGVDFHEVIGHDGVGNDLTQMHKALRAISGVAAMTNSSYEEISHVFTRIAGQGKVMAIDLNSIAARGINAAAELAKQLNVTEAEIRDMVSKGQIDFNTFAMAMDDAFGDHAKEANKTFSGSLSNMKAALSRIGAIFAQPVVDKTNTLFISITSRIKEFQKALNDTKGTKVSVQGLKKLTKAANEAADKYKLVGQERAKFIQQNVEESKQKLLNSKEELEKALDSGDAESYTIARFATHFAEAWESAINFASKFVEALDLSWFTNVGDFLDKTAQKIKVFFDAAATAIGNTRAEIEKASEGIKDTIGLDLQDIALLHRILSNEFGYVEKRWAALDKIYEDSGKTGKSGKWLQGYMDQLAAVGYDFDKLGWTEEKFQKTQEETAKTVAKAADEMTTQELIITTIAQTLVNMKAASDNVKTSVSDLFNTVISLGGIVAKVIYSIYSGLDESLNLSYLSSLIVPITNGIRDFAEALVPTKDELANLYETTSKIGTAINEFITPIADAAGKVITFAAKVIKARENLEELSKSDDLTDLERSVVSVLRVVSNFANVIKNVATSVIKIVGAIKRAFFAVFNPSGVLGGVADFTEGISNLSDKLVISDKVAEGLEVVFAGIFTVIQKIATVISKVIGGITKFISGGKKTVDVTKTVAGSIEKVADNTEQAVGIFGGLRDMLENIAEKLKKLPDKLKELGDEINKQEGVIRLKENIEKIKTSCKEAIDKAIVPFANGISNIGKDTEKTGDESSDAISVIAKVIGKASGEIADFLEKIPVWAAAVEKFFDKVSKSVNDFVDKLHLGDIFSNFANVTDFLGGDEETSIIERVKEFVGNSGDKAVEAVEGINWGTVGKAGFFGILAANLINFFKITSGVQGLLESIQAVPDAIKGAIESFGGIGEAITGTFTTLSGSIKKLANVYMIVSAVQALVALASAVILLAQLDEEKLKTGLGALLWIGTIAAMVLWALSAVVSKMPVEYYNQIDRSVDRSNRALLQINNQFGAFLGIAAILISTGIAAFLIFKSIGDLVEKFEGADDAAIGNAIKVVYKIGLAIMAFSAVMGALIHFAKFDAGEGLALMGVAAIITSLGAAVFLIAGAISLIDKAQISEKSWAALLAIILGITAFIFIAGMASDNISIKSAAGIAIMLGALCVTMIAIVGALAIVSGIVAGFDATGHGDAILVAMGVIVGIVLAMGIAIWLMASGMEDVKKPGGLALMILAMGGMLVLVAIALKSMVKSIVGATDNSEAVVLAITLMVSIVSILSLALLAMGKYLVDENASTSLLAIAAIFAAVGVAMLLIAASLKLISSVENNLGVGIAMLAIMVAAVTAIVITLGVLATKAGSHAVVGKLGDTFLSIAAMFLGIGAAMLLIAVAAKEIDNVSPESIWTVIGVMAAMLVLFGILGVVSGMNSNIGEGIEKVANGFLTFSVSMVLLAASIWILAKGLEAIANAIPKVVTSAALLFTAIEQHKGAAAAVLILIGAILVAVVVLSSKLGPIISAVGNILTKVFDFVVNGLKTIWEVISSTGTKIFDWIKDQSPRMKLAIASLIAAAVGGIAAASPEVLATIKKIIFKVLYFILDLIPGMVDILFDMLLRLINSLAEVIRKNSAEVAYAIWNVIEAILEVLIDVWVEAMLLFAKPMEALLDKLGLGDKYAKVIDSVTSSFSGMKTQLRSGMADLRKYTDQQNELYKSIDELGSAYEEVSSNGSHWGESTKKNAKETKSAADMVKDALASVKDGGANMGSLADMFSSFGGGENVSDLVANSLGNLNVDALTDSSALGDLNPEAMLENTGLTEENWADVGDMQGAAYTDGFAESISNPDSQAQIESATQDNIEVVNNTISSPENKKKLGDSVTQNIVRTISNSIWVGSKDINEATDNIFDGIERVFHKRYDSHIALFSSLGQAEYDAYTGPKGIDSNSPSKKFEKGGLNCILGIEKGLNENEKLATGAMTDLSDAMIDSFRDPLSYVSKVASGELEYDPSIRPVLDTTRIGNGAGAINSMFDNQNVTLSGLTGQIAYDMTELNNSNAAVVSELQALRADMSLLADEMESMQIVMDTGALVGSTVSAYDKALGQRSIYSGRGN